MLERFTIRHDTDARTVCRIMVEPAAHRCDVTVTVAGLIVNTCDETNPSFRSIGSAEWSRIDYWEGKARDIARSHSPYWRGEAVA